MTNRAQRVLQMIGEVYSQAAIDAWHSKAVTPAAREQQQTHQGNMRWTGQEDKRDTTMTMNRPMNPSSGWQNKGTTR